jgi:positive regulator of sigma E activity
LTDNAQIAAESPPSGWRHRASRAIDWLEPDHNPAGVVYGTLIIGAVLATESVRRETLLDTVGATVLALLLYWLAHSYATTLGERLDRKTPLSAATVVRSVLRDRAIVRGALVPILALLIASVLGATLSTAVLVAVWTSSGTIVAFEVLAGFRARLRGRELVVQICTGTVMGLMIIALRTVMH